MTKENNNISKKELMKIIVVDPVVIGEKDKTPKQINIDSE